MPGNDRATNIWRGVERWEVGGDDWKGGLLQVPNKISLKGGEKRQRVEVVGWVGAWKAVLLFLGFLGFFRVFLGFLGFVLANVLGAPPIEAST